MHSMASIFKLITLTVTISILTYQSFAMPEMFLPSINYEELIQLDESSAHAAANALVSLGALEIRDIPNYAQARIEALAPLAPCLLEEEEESVDSKKSNTKVVLPDGSVRRTMAASISRGVAGDFSISQCARPVLKLRSVVDAATRQLFLALDNLIKDKKHLDEIQVDEEHSAVMDPGFEYFTDIINQGEQLEHLHSYYRTASSNTLSPVPPTIDFHTDSGLFIAMTVGYQDESTENTVSEFSLQIKSPTGAVSRVKTSPDSLIIMVGEGGSQWLNPVLGVPLRAISHALVAVDSANLSLASGREYGSSQRSWYGRMYLPPKDALMPNYGKASPLQRLTYKEYRQMELAHFRRDPAETENRYLPSACGGSSVLYPSIVGASYGSVKGSIGKGNAFHLEADPSSCTSSEVYCWTTCMPASDLSCNTSAVCTDPATGKAVDGAEHCTSCVLQCPAPPPNSTSFCYGYGTSMYMDGFTSIITSSKGKTECLNLMFTDWTLDSDAKFGVAAVGVFLLAVATQWLTKFRLVVATHTMPLQRRTVAMCVLQVLLYGVQVALGYFLMLIAMTYSVELFVLVILGLAFGYGAFLMKLPEPIGTDPCCAQVDPEGLLPSQSEISLKTSLLQPSNHYLSSCELSIEGMTCGTCVAAVERALNSVEGVFKVKVSLKKNIAIVSYDPNTLTTDRLTATVDALGYSAIVQNVEDDV